VLIFERLASRFVDIKFQNIVYVWWSQEWEMFNIVPCRIDCKNAWHLLFWTDLAYVNLLNISVT
jgi:hypothetical protein